MISTSFILSTGEKKCMPTKFVGSRAGLRQAGDRQRRGVGGEKPPGAQHGLCLLGDLGLELAVLEHGLDDEVAAFSPSYSVVGVMRASTALPASCWSCGRVSTARCESFARVGLALLGVLERRSISTTSMPGHAPTRTRCRRPSCRRPARRSSSSFVFGASLGRRCQLDRLLHVEEERADHVRRDAGCIMTLVR